MEVGEDGSEEDVAEEVWECLGFELNAFGEEKTR
jgi:hypothetical protein